MMRNLETFLNEESLVSRLEALKLSGVAEEEIYVVSNRELSNGTTNFSNINFQKAEGSFSDKFAAFFGGDSAQDRVSDKLELSDQEKIEYDRALSEGKILLYVENDNAYNNLSSEYPNDSQKGNDFGSSHSGITSFNKETEYEKEDVVDMKNNNHNNDLEYQENEYKTTNLSDSEYVDTEVEKETTLNNKRESKSSLYNDQDENIKLHEERLRVDKDVHSSGEVTINKSIREETQSFDVPVSHDEVTIERRKVNETVAGDFDQHLMNEDTIRVPLTEERLNVTKENYVTEELVINKNRVQGTEHVSETTRHEEVEINDASYNHRDSDGFRTDKDGNLVDENGNRVDKDGNRI